MLIYLRGEELRTDNLMFHCRQQDALEDSQILETMAWETLNHRGSGTGFPPGSPHSCSDGNG